MRVALMIEGQEGVTWDDWCALADACEEHGVETLFRSDHYISQVGRGRERRARRLDDARRARRADDDAAASGRSSPPPPSALPALLANAAATADHVSGGRIELGLGAGWMEREHRAFGFPFPETARPHRDVRGAARDRAPALDGGARRLPRPPLHARGRARPAEAGAAARIRRSSSAAAARAAPPILPRASPTSTTRRSSSPEEFAAVRARVGARVRADGPRPGDDAVLDDDRLPDRRDARRRARARAASCTRAARATTSFDDWLARYAQRALVGSVDEVAARLREYERAGCDRVMLQHLLHTDLEPVRLIGRELAPAIA